MKDVNIRSKKINVNKNSGRSDHLPAKLYFYYAYYKFVLLLYFYMYGIERLYLNHPNNIER